MQRILSGFGITGSQLMLASGCRAALAAALVTSFRAPAAIADFKSGKRSSKTAPRSITSLPSIRPQLVAPLILKLANFICCPWEFREAGSSLSHAATAGDAAEAMGRQAREGRQADTSRLPPIPGPILAGDGGDPAPRMVRTADFSASRFCFRTVVATCDWLLPA